MGYQSILTQINNAKAAGFQIDQHPDSEYKWIITLIPPTDTAYGKGVFFLELHFPIDYPFRPPTVTMLTRIFHPNVTSTGQLTIGPLTGQWSPVWTVEKLLTHIQSLFKIPITHGVPMTDALKLYNQNRDEYIQTAIKFTDRYAI